MKKIILVDGNNLMFRSYYATAYTGNILKNSDGLPTNALYGFVSMINKIIEEENPEYMAVAFDIGKNFRHEKYDDYKAGRKETPEDLKLQMPIAKKILEAMGITSLEKEMYEADDIIGTLVKMTTNDIDYDATIVSSDKDLLQLINYETDVKLLKQKGHIRYNEEKFKEDFGIAPIRIIDLKALSGDPSDNIPGVKGIGDKTALNLLQKYENLDGIYEHIDEIKGALQNKLIEGKKDAYFSKEIATIYCDVPLEISLEDVKYRGINEEELSKIYTELEFYSFLRNIRTKKVVETVKFELIENDTITLDKNFAFYIECDKENYHHANILGMGVYDGVNSYFIKDVNLITSFLTRHSTISKYTYDLKKNLYLMKKSNATIDNVSFDAMISSYLLGYSNQDDIAVLMNQDNIDIGFYKDLLKTDFGDVASLCVSKAKYIYDIYSKHIENLESENMMALYQDIELPLIKVLCDMEYEGIIVKKEILKEMQQGVKENLRIVCDEIYEMALEKFNLASPRQLGVILFDKLGLPAGKKTANGYRTDVKTLHKIINLHPIVSKILEYRNLEKLNTTYLEGFYKYICDDAKVHTIFKQNLTRTGRLSSIEPNIQNIPAREGEARKIRKAFLASPDSVFLCADYSQIELRILAHISGDETLIEAFKNDDDIHTKVASDIFEVAEENVTSEMRKSAKAVIFGIVYGISGFGLGENLEISAKDAKKFIDKYYELYPKVKEYMDTIVIKAKEAGYVTTMFNRKRVIDELNSSAYMVRVAGERIALNTPIQGASADIIKKAMVEIAKEFKNQNIKSKMVMQVHDELIFDTLISEKEIVRNIVKDKMENVVTLTVPLKVKIAEGTNWYEA